MAIRLLLCIALSVGTAANACTPPPPPSPPMAGETDAAYRARLARLAAEQQAQWRVGRGREQARLWDASAAVLVGRVERVRQVKLTCCGTSQAVLVRPVRWLKGEGSGRPFWLNYTGMTTCGPYGGGDAVAGKPGERFVLFSRGKWVGSESVADSVGTRWAVEPRVVAALVSAAP